MDLAQGRSKSIDLKQLADLVTIRQYIVNAAEYHTVEKSAAIEMTRILPLVDKKLVEIILSKNFKEFIGYVPKAPTKDIKSGLK